MINNGLSSIEVINNRKKYGSNEINYQKKNKFLKLFLESFGDPIIKILLIALAIKLLFLFKDFNIYETIGIFIAVFLATFISTISEYGSETTFLKLQEESSKMKVKVKRDNNIQEVYTGEIVVNDIVLLETGNKIPADGYLISGNLEVDESVLNGESKEVKKIPYYKGEKNQVNLLYSGTTVYSGVGTMLVEKVGKNTFYGRLAQEVMEKEPISPLKERLTYLAKIISKIGYLGALLATICYLFSVIIVNNNFNISLIKETITNFPLMMNYLIYALTLSVTIIVVAVPDE